MRTKNSRIPPHIRTPKWDPDFGKLPYGPYMPGESEASWDMKARGLEVEVVDGEEPSVSRLPVKKRGLP